MVIFCRFFEAIFCHFLAAFNGDFLPLFVLLFRGDYPQLFGSFLWRFFAAFCPLFRCAFSPLLGAFPRCFLVLPHGPTTSPTSPCPAAVPVPGFPCPAAAAPAVLDSPRTAAAPACPGSVCRLHFQVCNFPNFVDQIRHTRLQCALPTLRENFSQKGAPYSHEITVFV